MPPGRAATSSLPSPFVLTVVGARPGGPSSTSTGTGASTSTSASGRRRRGRCSRRRRVDRPVGHLEGNNPPKRPRGVIVRNLQEAHALLAVDLARAGRPRGDREGDVKVLVDVCGALLDDARALEQGADVRLLGDAARAVAVLAGHVGRRLGEGPVGKGARGGGVDDGLYGAAAVGGDDVEDACDLGVYLREGAAAGELLWCRTVSGLGPGGRVADLFCSAC